MSSEDAFKLFAVTSAMNMLVVKEWSRSAKLDLDSIYYLINQEHLTPVIAFHAQQAIEKTLKGRLEFKNVKALKTHKLQSLFALAAIDLEIDEDVLIVLDDLYVDSRYPGEFGLLPEGNPTTEDARQFYGLAEYVFDRVCQQLNFQDL